MVSFFVFLLLCFIDMRQKLFAYERLKSKKQSKRNAIASCVVMQLYIIFPLLHQEMFNCSLESIGCVSELLVVSYIILDILCSSYIFNKTQFHFIARAMFNIFFLIYA